MTDHMIGVYDDDINHIRAIIAEMGAHGHEALAQAMAALARHDEGAARRIVDEDRQLDTLENEVEEGVAAVLVKYAPLAVDMREAVAALKIAGELERIGDYAKNIARRVPMLPHSHNMAATLLGGMHEVVLRMINDAVEAFERRDEALAAQVWEADRQVDDYHESIFRALVTNMIEDTRMIGESAHLLFVAKNLERAGDHATNIAEMVYYAATGERLADRPRGGEPGV